MTPLEINMLLHVYAYNDPLYVPTMTHQSFVDGFIENELIEKDPEAGCGYRLQPRGAAYVQFLQSLPLPIANWTIPGPWTPSMKSPVSAPHPKEK